MKLSKNWLLGLLLILFVSFLAACSDGEESADDNSEETGTQENEQAPEMPEPDLEGVPEVVAEVNDTEITKEEFTTAYEAQFQQMAMQSQMTGQELDQEQLKKQIADSMVGTELLLQEAENRDYSVTEEEIDETLSELAERNGLGSKDELIAAFEEQGTSEEEVISQVQTQVKLDKLIAEESGDIEPTEEELKEAYEQAKSQQEQMAGEEGGTEMPSYEDVKPQLKDQLKQQKEGEVTMALIEELRGNADVTVHL
ncbi:SurA N-terminal domain-containing protein [Virgibacillus xinjiangensis]|uniref:peptidylprolyl isomerase n=1 Tax=Virgibacillus xinjiangensis TaxID=393090 RepID=A0ABV7CW00_9BACI